MIVTDERLAEWQAIADAATPECWTSPYDPEAHVQATVITEDGDHVADAYDNTSWTGDQCRANARFIAAARTAVPALAAEVRRLRVDMGHMADTLQRFADERDQWSLRALASAQKVERLRDVLEEVERQLNPDRYLTPGERERLHQIVDVVLRETAE